jgi:hypothetical protein
VIYLPCPVSAHGSWLTDLTELQRNLKSYRVPSIFGLLPFNIQISVKEYFAPSRNHNQTAYYRIPVSSTPPNIQVCHFLL